MHDVLHTLILLNTHPSVVTVESFRHARAPLSAASRIYVQSCCRPNCRWRDLLEVFLKASEDVDDSFGAKLGESLQDAMGVLGIVVLRGLGMWDGRCKQVDGLSTNIISILYVSN